MAALGIKFGLADPVFGISTSDAAEVPAIGTPNASTGFMRLSQFLTGKTALDAALANAIDAALNDVEPGFDKRIDAVNAYIDANRATAETLQGILNASKDSLADVPKKVMTAWYLGYVGSGAKARAVAYEQALMYRPIADVIVMPTYARGIPGYWAAPPAVLAQHSASATTAIHIQG